ncbi:MAG: phosphoribosylglycinamide formyltransferase [Candidatus Falkowbacteria bacterium]|nr:MAG: phosphoribosylglycinamide formyltransferase [Candidatus Falkowbacteria bacterium]
MRKPKILPFASGTKDGGGSGFEVLFHAIEAGKLNAEMVGVVSNHAHGGVRERADRLGIPFYFMASFEAEDYQKIALESGANFFPLSGWLKKIKGLDLNTIFNSKTVFNIHPGLLPTFGGFGMYGHHVHEAVFTAYQAGKLSCSGITMHFVDEEFDHGPTFFQLKIFLSGIKNPEQLGSLVNSYEHRYQANITDLVVNGQISWDGKNPNSLIVPADYQISQWA